jgi:DNA-binding NarL/FixJ family response regulator
MTTPDDAAVVRVLLADDHTMLREGLRRSLEGNGLTIVGEASDGDDVVTKAKELNPDVILMDVSMPIRDGVEAARLVKEAQPNTAIVMLTMHADVEVIQRAIRAGAAGYLTKDCSTEEIVRTIKLAANGESALSPEVAGALLAEANKPAPEPIISRREEEVLQLIADGCSTPEVAERLYISVKTVKNHLASAYQKLDAADRTQAVVRALKMGIIKLDE